MSRFISLFTVLTATLIFTASAQAQSEQKPGSITGKVVDARTLETLIGVNVLIENTTTGDATDIDGKFRIENLKPGVYNLLVRYIGYESQILTDIVVGANRSAEVNIKMNAATIEGEEVTVSAGYFQERGTGSISKVSFTPEELRRSPGSAQEFSRVLTALPSVASIGETSQDIFVRGGAPMENGFIIDNIPLPDIRHFRDQAGQSNGPIGIVNSELISDISFSAGGFDAKFGDKLSSFSEISYRDGNEERVRGDVGANLAGFNLNFDGPLPGANGTFLISARRSYLDLIADAINAGGAPRYSDLQAKMTYDIDRNNKLTFLNIYGTSTFESSIQDAIENGEADATYFQTEQNTTGLNWRRLWNKGYSNTSFSYSTNSQDQLLSDIFTRNPSVDLESTEQSLFLRNVNYLQLNDRNSIEFGTDLEREWNDFEYFIVGTTNTAGQVRPDFRRSDAVNGSLASVFASITTQPLNRLTVTLGSRLNYNTYNEDLTFAPRTQLRYQLSQRLALTGAAGIYYQTLPRYLISQNAQIANLRSTQANHLIAGIDYQLSRDTKLTLEAFNKEYFNAPVLPANNNVGDRSYVLDNAGAFYESLDDDGRAYARGVEMLIQKKLAVNFYGMFSASYFRTRYEDFNGEELNRNFDNRYLLSFIGGYRPNDIWELSLRWTMLGGRPNTPADIAASDAANTLILDQAQFNSDRLSAYHSLFVRADRRFFFRQTNMVVFLEIWNVYNHNNVRQEFWNVVDRQVDEISQFSFLPVSGIKFEF